MANECAPLHFFHALGKKHFVPVLDEFYHQKYAGFNVLTRKLGITPKQLAERMKEMEEMGLLVREAEQYALTPKGKELGALIAHIKQFHANYGSVALSCAQTACSDCIHALKKVTP